MQPVAVAQHTPAEIEGLAKISGRIVRADGKSARNARVLAVHLSSGRTFSSSPTKGNGEYELTGLPYGYYDLAVEAEDGLYVSDRVVNAAPASETAVLFTLSVFDGSTRGLARRHPASDEEPAGLAEMRRKLKGREFWRSPRGVAIIASLAGAGLLAIAAGSDTELAATGFE